MTPEDLREWGDRVKADEGVIAAVMVRAHRRNRALDAIDEAVGISHEAYAEGKFKGDWNYERYSSWIVVVANNHLVTEHRRFGRQHAVGSLDSVPDRDGNA